MKNENIRNSILLLVVLLFVATGCGNFGRIVEVYKTDTIKIANGLVRDTTFIFQKSSDTIRTEYSTIYRTGDTLRMHYIERPCTTYISKTEIRPTSHTKETRRERPFYQKLNFLDKLILIIILSGIVLILLQRFLNAGSKRH
jgi:hypothetical protein